MPSDYYFGYYFFAPGGRFQPCGMFTMPHIIAAVICIIAVITAVLLAKERFTQNVQTKFFRVTAIILTVLEIIKISHSFIYKDLHLDAWFPLSYCGLFIFALWFAGYGGGKTKSAGETYITYGCIIAGGAFLMFPTTSLMSFPIWHYFSIYSMLFHSVMVFSSVMMLLKEKELKTNKYKAYIFFILSFSIIAIAMNVLCGSNLMNLREPYNIPIKFLQNLYTNVPWGYTVLVLICYLIIPPFIALLSGKIKRK